MVCTNLIIFVCAYLRQLLSCFGNVKEHSKLRPCPFPFPDHASNGTAKSHPLLTRLILDSIPTISIDHGSAGSIRAAVRKVFIKTTRLDGFGPHIPSMCISALARTILAGIVFPVVSYHPHLLSPSENLWSCDCIEKSGGSSPMMKNPFIDIL